MKTLADLKRNANKFQWSLIKNSWFGAIPEHQLGFRDVGTMKTIEFSLLTNKNGELTDSWIEWPKASELTMHKVIAHGICMGYEVTFTRDTGAVNPHVMIYWLRPVEEKI